MILLVTLQAQACNFTKSNTLPWVFSCFLNCTNGIKWRKASEICNQIFQHSVFPVTSAPGAYYILKLLGAALIRGWY